MRIADAAFLLVTIDKYNRLLIRFSFNAVLIPARLSLAHAYKEIFLPADNNPAYCSCA
jgi:hypothetical protein